MKTTLETIIKQTRSALLEEARWQEQMHRSDAAKHLQSVAEHPPEEMLWLVADMVTTVDDLSGLDEREAQVEDVENLVAEMDQWSDACSRLASGVDYELAYQTVRTAIDARCTIEELRQLVGLDPTDEPVLHAGSDIGEGRLNVGHWMAKLLASSFIDWLDQVGAENFLTTSVVDKRDGSAVEVTIQRAGKKTTADTIRELREALAQKEGHIDDLRGLAEREALVDDGRPIDATGEPLEVGDLVRVEGELWVVARIQRRAGQWQIIFDEEKWTWSLPEHCTKITTLTREEYLPLARRTMDPDLTKKERLAMLAMGVIGETNEFLNSYGEDEVGEGGDVLWYAEQLLAEVGPPGPNTLHYDTDETELWEVVKKAVFHGVDVDILGALAVDAIEAVEEVVVNDHGVLLGEVRVKNIKKLIKRYPDGFVAGGGVR